MRFFFLIVALFFAAFSHAADMVPADHYYAALWPGGTMTYSKDPQEQCASLLSQRNAYVGGPPMTSPSWTGGLECSAVPPGGGASYAFGGLGEWYSCSDGTAPDANHMCVAISCPAGLQLLGGKCVKDCSGKLGQPTPSPSNEFANDGGSPTVSGCEVNCDTWAAPKGSTVLLPPFQVGSNCKFTGHPPTGDGTEGTGFKPAPDAPKRPSDCTGAGMGYVQTSSGTTCVPASSGGDSAPNVTDKKVSTTGPAGSDGGPAAGNPDTQTTTTETRTDPSTGKTTTTTTTTSAPSTGSDGTKTCPSGMIFTGDVCQRVTASTQSTDTFCQEHPTAPACGGPNNSDACSEHPDRASCANFGDPAQSDSSALPVRDVGVSSITEVTLNSDSTCPAGAYMPFGIGAFPMDGICMFASGMKPIIIVMAWVSAALIVIGAFRGDS